MRTNLKRTIIPLLIITFLFMAQISVAPLLATDEPPGAVEKSAPTGQAAKKSSPLIPILIGVVVVGAVAAVLILVVFKTKYEIMGTWQLSYDLVGYDSATIQITFTGTKESGTFTESYGNTGTYTVDGKKVHFSHNEYVLTWDGEFTGKDAMSGTAVYVCPPTFNGTWQATRISSAAKIPQPKAAVKKQSAWGQ